MSRIMTDQNKPSLAGSADKPLTPAARRALEEAAERRAKLEAENDKNNSEINGPSGPEPTRYGDWERKGVAYDF
ncbi:DUF1674 domain-containing protein [Hyphobacterium sp.]|jgi:hypothetical protein|uniref:DUF1674 domain-containing protein n=1 Tax=Hyphobacterium sp. TaxID=2004662 RepID=UPI003BA9303E